MSNRITRTQVDALAAIVNNLMVTARSHPLCPSCQRRGVDVETSYYPGCVVMAQGGYGGTSIRMRHADTGESDLSGGYGPMREAYTFLRGMRSALTELS